MKLIRPIAVTDTTLTDSNVTESEAAWSNATRYTAGQIVRGETTAASHTLYEALTPGTSQVVTLTIASPCVVSWANHGLANGTEVLIETTGALPTGLTAGTIYFVVSAGTNDFRLATTAGGAPINTSGSQSGVHTLFSRPNKNKAPSLNPSFWLEVGPTNRFRMFDQSVTSQTENAESIEVEITPGALVNSVALLNLSATSVTVTMTDPVDGEVYDRTLTLLDNDAVIDWFSYFFEPITQRTDIVLTDLPLYGSAAIEIAIDAPSGTAKCGACIVGQSRVIGQTAMGASVGIQDFSVKTRDDFGNFVIAERSFSRRASFTVLGESAERSAVYRLLSSLRATPVVWIGSEEIEPTLIYGFARDWDIGLDLPDHFYLTLEIEGLT